MSTASQHDIVPSGSHCDRSTNNAKSAMLKRMYQEEEVHFGTPNPEFICPTPDGKLNLNPIAMTRMGLSWRGAKEFNDAYSAKRHARFTVGQTSPKEAELFSGTHLMHPGTVPSGVSSSVFAPRDLNPMHGPDAVSEARRHFQDPRTVTARTKELLDARRRWIEEEAADAAAVLAEGRLSKDGLDHAQRKYGLGVGGGGKFHGAAMPQGTLRSPGLRRKHAVRPEHGAMGTSFVFRSDLAYETANRPSFSVHAASNARAARAGASVVADGGAETAAATGVHGATVRKGSALHAGMIRAVRDVKYGEFTAECDLPHRNLDLHPIGY